MSVMIDQRKMIQRRRVRELVTEVMIGTAVIIIAVALWGAA